MRVHTRRARPLAFLKGVPQRVTQSGNFAEPRIVTMHVRLFGSTRFAKRECRSRCRAISQFFHFCGNFRGFRFVPHLFLLADDCMMHNMVLAWQAKN